MPRQTIDVDGPPGSAGWPPGVRPITFDETGQIGVDSVGGLYWRGKPVEVASRLSLSRWQRAGAVIVTLAAVVGGLGGAVQGVAAAQDLGCKRGWWDSGCGSR